MNMGPGLMTSKKIQCIFSVSTAGTPSACIGFLQTWYSWIEKGICYTKVYSLFESGPISFIKSTEVKLRCGSSTVPFSNIYSNSICMNILFLFSFESSFDSGPCVLINHSTLMYTNFVPHST